MTALEAVTRSKEIGRASTLPPCTEMQEMDGRLKADRKYRDLQGLTGNFREKITALSNIRGLAFRAGNF
jgi:hypothetical protein